MRKRDICLGENKGADQLRSKISFAVTAKLISAFVFATWIVKFLYFLNPKFLLCLYSSVCVRPVRKSHCWFSHEAAHVMLTLSTVVQETLRETKSYPATDYYGSLRRKFSSPTLNLLRRTKSSIKILRDRSEWQLAHTGPLETTNMTKNNQHR